MGGANHGGVVDPTMQGSNVKIGIRKNKINVVGFTKAPQYWRGAGVMFQTSCLTADQIYAVLLQGAEWGGGLIKPSDKFVLSFVLGHRGKVGIRRIACQPALEAYCCYIYTSHEKQYFVELFA